MRNSRRWKEWVADKPQTLKRVGLCETPNPKGVGGWQTLNPKTNGWLRLRVGAFETPNPTRSGCVRNPKP